MKTRLAISPILFLATCTVAPTPLPVLEHAYLVGTLVIANHDGSEETDLRGTGYIVLVEGDYFRRDNPDWGMGWGPPLHPGGQVIGVGVVNDRYEGGPQVWFAIDYNATEIDPELDYFIEVHYWWQERTITHVTEDGLGLGWSIGQFFSNAPGDLAAPTQVLTKGHPVDDVEVEVVVTAVIGDD